MKHEDLLKVKVGDFLQCKDSSDYFEVSFITDMRGWNHTLGDISLLKFYFKDNAHLPATEPSITNFRLTTDSADE